MSNSTIRQFSVLVHKDEPRTRIYLVSVLGPLVEAWNRKHDRRAALVVANKICAGEKATMNNNLLGSSWEINFTMTGCDADDAHIEAACALIVDALAKS